mgnify:FL=1
MSTKIRGPIRLIPTRYVRGNVNPNFLKPQRVYSKAQEKNDFSKLTSRTRTYYWLKRVLKYLRPS